MKSMFMHGLAVALGMAGILSDAHAQQGRYGSPSLLPMPQAAQRYPISQTSAFYNYQDQAGSVDDAPPPPEFAPQATPDYPNHGGMAPEQIGSEHIPTPAGQYPQAAGGCQSCGDGFAPAPAAYPAYGYGHGPRGYGLGHGWLGLHGHGWMKSMFHPGNCNALCGDVACVTAGNPRCGWFGGVKGLIMNRDNEDHYHFSFGSGFQSLQLLDTRDAEMDYSAGAEAHFGRYFCCGRKAWEVRYWGIYPEQQESVITSAQVVGNLDAILNFDQLEIGGLGVENWVNNADAHRVRRQFQFNNAEFNIINYAGCAGYGCCGQQRFHVNWGYGFRLFIFNEDLEFAARDAGSGVAFVGGEDQVTYNVETDNHLFGFQGSCDMKYNITCKLALTMNTKVGLFANYIEHKSRIHANGRDAVIDNGPNLGRSWNVASSKDDVAFLGEINMGLDYQLSCRWSLNAGYRAMAIAGVALPSEQIPSDLRGIDDALFIDSNGSLILHGAYFGAEYNY